MSAPVNQYKMLWLLCVLVIYCSWIYRDEPFKSNSYPPWVLKVLPNYLNGHKSVTINCGDYQDITNETHAHISELIYKGTIPDYKCQAPFPE